MNKIFFTVLFMLAILSVHAQKSKKEDDKKFDFLATGTFSKPKIVPDLDKLAIAQATVIFKNATTKEFLENERGGLLGGRKSGGGTVSGRLTAYLEITDGELNESDYREITDHFYSYFCKKLNENGVSTVEWDKITAAEFYKDNDEKEDMAKSVEENKKKGQIAIFYNAQDGNTIRHYNPAKSMNPGFAFGKIKKAANFSDDIEAPVLYIHAVLDFANIVLDGDVKTGESEHYNAGGSVTITKTKQFKFNSTVTANMKVMGESDWDGKYMGGEIYFTNKKMQADLLRLKQNINADVSFATEVSKDPEKAVLKRSAFLGLTKNFDAVPVVVSTTKEKYKEAAKKALENYSDELVDFIKSKK